MHIKNQQVIAANSEGLGNRIKCIVSASLRERGAKIFWPKNNSIDCDFTTLFDNHSRVIHEIPSETEVITSWRLTGFPADLLPLGFATYGDHSREESRRVDFEYNRIPASIKDLLLPQFKSLVPSKAVLAQIQRTQKKLSPGTVSVHVRSWFDSSTRAYKFSISEYYKIMDEFPGCDFYIACDSTTIINKFNKRYPGRVIVHELTNDEKMHGNQYQQALAEMCLLSKNKWLIASYGSTFSEVAWWLGGANAEVHVAPLRRFTGKIDDINYVYLFLYIP